MGVSGAACIEGTGLPGEEEENPLKNTLIRQKR